MKKIIGFLILSLFIASCGTNTSFNIEKDLPEDSAKKDSVIPAILDLFGYEAKLIQSIGDSMYSSITPETALNLIKCNDSLVEFNKNISEEFKYKVEIKLSVSDNQDDSLKSKIKSVAITTAKIDIRLSKYLFEDLKNVIPCNIKVFISKNKRNLLIFPYGSNEERSLRFIINSSMAEQQG